MRAKAIEIRILIAERKNLESEMDELRERLAKLDLEIGSRCPVKVGMILENYRHRIAVLHVHWLEPVGLWEARGPILRASDNQIRHFGPSQVGSIYAIHFLTLCEEGPAVEAVRIVKP